MSVNLRDTRPCPTLQYKSKQRPSANWRTRKAGQSKKVRTYWMAKELSLPRTDK